METADKAPLVIVKGMAGTAKTFYSWQWDSKSCSIIRPANTDVSS